MFFCYNNSGYRYLITPTGIAVIGERKRGGAETEGYGEIEGGDA